MDNGLTITTAMSANHSSNITDTIKSMSKRLLGFIKQRVNSAEDAEDIMQDVFFQFAGNPEPIEQASNWLFTVARNKITDNYRKKKLPLAEDILGGHGSEEELDWKEIMLPADSTPETDYLRSIFWEELQSALDELPEEQRTVFIQNELDGIAFKDISEQTGVSVATLISRKRYAVLHLRNRLKTLKEELLNY